MDVLKRFEYKKYQYYLIVAVTSIFAVFFLPMVGSSADVALKLPQTMVGWIVYIVTKLMVAAINLVLFYCFMEQAKVNVKDNPNYKEANEILAALQKITAATPRSPQEWQRGEYKNKGIWVAVTTILSAFALTQAILTFDWLMMLTYFFTIIMGVIFGVIQMNAAEQYWTVEYHQYALMKQQEAAQKQQQERRAAYNF